jgi:hypothetical protein
MFSLGNNNKIVLDIEYIGHNVHSVNNVNSKNFNKMYNEEKVNVLVLHFYSKKSVLNHILHQKYSHNNHDRFKYQ